LNVSVHKRTVVTGRHLPALPFLNQPKAAK
jgi:hypothetical protein